MISERFKRTKSVMASAAIALVIAALAFGVSSSVLGPKSAIAQHLGFDLTSGSSSFTITSSIYPSPVCAGSTALLYPGTPRCMVFSVHNNLSVPISVGSITSALDTTNYPAPPPACTGSNLTLPTYSGSLAVPANGDATSSGVPVELNDSGSTQDICQKYTYHFTYSGLANYTDSTTTNLTSTPNPSSSTQSVTFTATVTETNGGIDPSGPTGTMTFYSCTSNACGSKTSLGTGTVGSNGQATLSTSSLAIGTDYIEAVYGGSGTNLTGSTSNVVTQTVTSGLLSTTSALTSSPNPSTSGAAVTFTDTVSASSGSPTGMVTFYSCTTSACSTKTSLATETLSGGKATYSTSTFPAGTTFVESIYGGSGNYVRSTSNVVTQLVNALSTKSVLTSSPNPSSYGASVTFSDTVSASSGTPAGNVTFYSCTTNACGTKTSLGTGTLASGKAALVTSSLPVGTTYVEAVYGASGNYGGSTSNVVAQVVNGASTSTALTSSPNPSTYGQSVLFTAMVSSGVGMPTGTVTFYSCTTSACSTKTSLGTGTLVSGKATYSMTSFSAGTTYVEAVYGASGNYGGSTSNVVAQVVNGASTSTALTSSPNPSTYGQSVLFTATVSSTAGTPTGTVSFYGCSASGCTPNALLGTGTLSAGKATFSTSILPVGIAYIDAVYGASGNYATSTSGPVAQVVNALSSTTKLASSPNPSTYGTSVTFTATVSATTGSPTGTVTFYSCTTSSCGTTTLLGTGSLRSNGQATYNTSSLPVGTTHVEAVYGASGNYLGSTSSPSLAQVVNAASTTTSLTSSPNPSSYGAAVNFTATVSASPGTPSGTVTFYSCTTTTCGTKTWLGTGTLSGGKALYSTTSLPVGTTYVEAVYGGSLNYATSTSSPVTQKVSQASTGLVLSASPNPSRFGQAITLSAQTTPGAGPTGTVSFYQDAPPNGDLIDKATLNASGQATLVTSTLPPGTYAVYAVYSGDANYLSSQSNTLTLTVGYSSACLTGTISTGYTVAAGQSVCISGRVSGGISVQAGGALFLNGATVSGGITSNGAAAIRFCGSTISGNVTVSATTGYVMVGDGGDDGTPACADNSVTGNVTFSGNTGGIEVAGDTMNGTLSVSGNTGGREDPEIEGNHINGSLSCATSNNPTLTDGGHRNTVSGSRIGQCSAGSF